jgi:thiol-disulfide isomerase/thioredoxin
MRTFVVAAFALGCSSRSEPHKDPSPKQVAEAAPAVADAAPARTGAVLDAAPAPPPDPNRALDAQLEWYRITAMIGEPAEMPFAIGLSRDKPEGWIASGTERLPIAVIERSPFVLRIPVRGAELRFGPGAGGKLRGQWLISYYFKRDFDIVAEKIEGPATENVFPGGEPPAFDVSGTWRVDIKEFGVGRATFRQDARGMLTGTIIPPEVGDLRYLVGRLNGTRARLTAFDGVHGFLVEFITENGGRQLTGHWMVAGIGDFPFIATRDEAPPTHVKVSAHMAPGKTRISLPGLDRPPYAGKPVIVEYFGSWCPVCLDLIPELVRLQREHAAEGLQVRSIAVEPPGDNAEARHRLEEFRKEFGVTWPFEMRYTDEFNSVVPHEVVDATGFPVTIFLRRDHTVAAIHTGFVSRAAGPEHDEAVKHLDEIVASIVAPASPSQSRSPAPGKPGKAR